jgi:hypothetical protein
MKSKALDADTDMNALNRLADAMVEEILNTPCEKLLAETAEEYGDPHALAKKFDMVLQRAFLANRPVEATASRPGLGARIADFFSPSALAWTATAAAVIVMLQAGVIARMVLEERNNELPEESSHASYNTINTYGSTNSFTGINMLVRFRAGANAADIAAFLYSHNLSIVRGPDKDGTYVARLFGPSSKYDVDVLIAELRADTSPVIAFRQVE